MFMMAAVLMAVVAMAWTGCKNEPTDPNQAKIAEVKKAAMGSWEGVTEPVYGAGEEVVVTFTEDKVSAAFAEETVSANIKNWKCVDGQDVWIDMDDDMRTSMYVKVEGDKMWLTGNSSFFTENFPRELTKKK